MVLLENSKFSIEIADNQTKIDKAMKLRYNELLLHYNCDSVNENDYQIYDNYCKHLIAVDKTTDQIVGYYRIILSNDIKNGNTYYSQTEFNIDQIINSNKKVLELSRAVVKQEYRSGAVILMLWKGIIKYCVQNDIDYIMGLGSYLGVNANDYAQSLSYLYYNTKPVQGVCSLQSDNLEYLIDKQLVDEKVAIRQLPQIIKGYLMFNANFSKTIFVDKPFNSIDVFIILDMKNTQSPMLQKLLKSVGE